MIPNNACTLRLTAAAGTELAGASFGGTVMPPGYSPRDYSSHLTGLYDPKAFFTHAASLVRVSPIAQYSSLLPPVGVWTVYQFSVAGRPLRPATHRCLGKPLPYQLANGTRAHLYPTALLRGHLCRLPRRFAGLCGISTPFGVLSPRQR